MRIFQGAGESNWEGREQRALEAAYVAKGVQLENNKVQVMANKARSRNTGKFVGRLALRGAENELWLTAGRRARLRLALGRARRGALAP